jgi:ferrochelatase
MRAGRRRDPGATSSPQVPWLEPDVNDALRESAERGRRQVLLVPIGFISDHMEVLWDLDNEARATADELGLELVRLPTPGVHAAFVGLLADLLASAVPGVGGPAVGYCSSTCCRNAREDRPVVPGSARRA